MKDSHDSKHANIVCISAPFGGIGGIAPDVHPLNRQGPVQKAHCSPQPSQTNGPHRGALTRQSVVLAARLINRYSVCASVLCLHGAVYWLRWPAGASLRDTAGRLCQLVAQALRGYNAITF